MKRLAILLSGVMIGLGVFAQKVSAPDFAYPKKVIAQSESALKTAQKRGDGPATLRGLVNLSLAEMAVDADRLTEVVKRIKQVRRQERDSVTAAMTDMLLARVLGEVYRSDPYKFDQRVLPNLNPPADPMEWSGEMFRTEIGRLYRRALANGDRLKEVALEDWKTVLTSEPYADLYFPTLFDFAAARYIQYCQRSAEETASDYFAPGGKGEMLNLVDELIRFHRDQPAARIHWEYERFRFADTVKDVPAETQLARIYDIYNSNVERTEFAADVLFNVPYYNSTSEGIGYLYNLINRFDKKYPNYLWRKNLDELRRNLEKKKLAVRAVNVCAPLTPINLKIEALNVTDGCVDIYKVDESQVNTPMVLFEPSAKCEKIRSIAVSVGDSVGSFGKMTVPVVFPQDGCYICVARPDKDAVPEKAWLSVIRVTSIVLLENPFDSGTLYALSPKDGVPLANVSLYRIDGEKSRTFAGRTDDEGMWKVTKSGNYVAKYGKDSISEMKYTGVARGSYRNREVANVKVLTSLSLYHPGDSMEWAAVCYQQTPMKKMRSLTDRKLMVRLYDANHTEVDAVEAITDSFGRVAGSFAIPEGGLPGEYQISVEAVDGKNDINGNGWFTVADYKLATFAVEPEKAVKVEGGFRLRGTVKSYTGFPMAGSRVKVTVDVSTVFSRGTVPYNDPIFTAEVNTDSEGRFSLMVPDGVLITDDSGIVYTADFSVTSTAGETRGASIVFFNQPVYRIEVNRWLPKDIAAPVEIPVKVTDIEDKIVTLPVGYRLTAGDSLLSEGEFTSGMFRLPTENLRPCEARLKLWLKDSPEDSLASSIILYDSRSDITPCPDDPVWTPLNLMELGSTRRGELPLWVPMPTSLLYALVAPDNTVIEQRRISLAAGKHSLTIALPDTLDRAKARFFAVSNYHVSSFTVNVTAPDARRKLIIRVESMRDRVIPGTPETWTFRVEPTDGTAEAVAMMLDMYNSALNLIKNHSFKLSTDSYYFPDTPRGINPASSLGRILMLTGQPMNFFIGRADGPQILPPMIDTYGRSFFPGMMMIRGTRMYKNAVMTADGVDMAMAGAMNYDGLDEGAEEEAAVDADGAAAEPEFAYRDREVPLAFFKPMLTTDDDGRLTLTFTVPNANTRWSFNAIAFTRDLLAANIQADVVASKPVMVQPNLPRFARSGDRVEIPAIVMNNTDNRAEITTEIEIFDAATGSVLTSERHTDMIAPHGSTTMSITVDVPMDAPLIGYRVKSSTDAFADGEQALLPVLPASQPVITAKPFFIPAGEKNFSMELPKISDKARVTLEYCGNPAWFVVTALPGLYDNKSGSTVGAAHSLFAAAVADGIVRKYPAVASALARWTASDRTDSTLVSMLERNADLKIAMLQATPWMMDARSDTERMDRLALILNRRTIDDAISSAVDLLRKRQKQGGGWCWLESGEKADYWTTMIVLRMMGRLNSLGFMPKDASLDGMIRNAVGYIDAQVAERYREQPKGNYMEYVYMRDMFPDVRQSSAAGRVSSATVQQLIGRWADLAPQAKGAAATILYRHNYAATARNILESLREYAVSSPEQGMWWPSMNADWWSLSTTAMTGYILEAFAMVEPGCDDIEKICHWLVNQKAAQNWGDMISTSSLIATFLSATPTWVAPAVPPTVKIGEEIVAPPSIDRNTGYFRTDITRLHPSGERLTVAGNGATPSWGAVYINDVQQLTAIEPDAIEGLEISKSYIVVGADGTVRNADGRLHVGDRVRVTLTIKVGRTMDYVAIVDNRAACFEPVDQLPGYVYSDGLGFYRVNADAATSLFINRLPKGTYVLSYDMNVNNAGVFTAGAATIQSQLAPSLTARSSGATFAVE